jgi:hypothetical protein
MYNIMLNACGFGKKKLITYGWNSSRPIKTMTPITNAYRNKTRKNQPWTEPQLHLLCCTWWCQSNYISNKAVCQMFRDFCREENISLRGKSDNAILIKIRAFSDLNIWGKSWSHSRLHTEVFEKVRHKIDYMIEQTFPRGH